MPKKKMLNHNVLEESNIPRKKVLYASYTRKKSDEVERSILLLIRLSY